MFVVGYSRFIKLMCNLQFNRNWSLFKPLALNGDVKAFGFYVPIVEEAHNVFPLLCLH